MKKMNLQLFNEAVSGKKIVYLYRLLKNKTTKAAANLAFVTENGRTVSVDSDSTATKDGPIRTPGTPEIEITTESVLAKGDTLVDELQEAQLNGDTIEIWEANLDEPVTSSDDSSTTNQFKGRYYQGLITEFELTSSAEDYTSVSMTFGISGKGVSGNVTVTAEQQELAAYVFADTQRVGNADTQQSENVDTGA